MISFNEKDKRIYNVYNLYSIKLSDIFLISSSFYIENDTRVLRFLSKSISEFHNLDLFVYYLTRKSEFFTKNFIYLKQNES